MSQQFLASLESQAVSVKFPKAKEEQSIVSWPRLSQQAQDGYDGGYRVGR